ncbi:GAF sensor-containing diguanylate cyclase/phosphodiesterase [Pseudomonas aeruginosa]|uniref:EAL domain-containing protein n=1 Tax=Pseudomonas aeruginosa TaxID=287 RepID=UPI000E021F4D|nr:GAF sensor-containing diguanylate cyclase/phosphodiesterase [Pseudomonas aeruginosa]
MMISRPRSIAVGACAGPDLELALVVQPVMHLGSRHPSAIAYECLLRVVEGTQLAAPARLIASAEADGSIVDLDRWVVSQAGSDRWSVSKCASLGERLADLRQRYPIHEHAISEFDRHEVTSRMTFEITESADGDACKIVKGLERLNLKAMPVMLDDLRDGFAKRQLLMNRAVTGCKLSRRTTRDIAESPAVRGEVEKLVRDCRAAGKRVVLEGSGRS